MKPIFQLDNVSATYNGVDVLHSVNHKFMKGEFVSLVGPNGAGKSTLLKLLASLLEPTEGRIQMSGKPLESINSRDLARKIGYLPQDNRSIFSLSCFDMVMIGRTPHLSGLMLGSETDRKIVKRVMTETDCWQFAERDFNKISVGEKQRVLIARALASEPELLLLDEPVASLDLEHAVMIYNLLDGLNRKGITIITVSHNLNFTARYTDKILLMRDGMKIESGKPAEILKEEILVKIYGESFNLISVEDYEVPVIIPRKKK